MELILVRHGITPGNLERRFVGRIDQPLAPEGVALAHEVAPTMPAIDGLYRSPMLRCKQTAEILWPQMTATVIEDLHETDFGIYEGRSHLELQDDPVYQRWLRGELAVGESIENCTARAEKALSELIADAQTQGYQRIGVVAHGGIFAAMLTKFGSPPRGYYDWIMPNCGGYRVALQTDPTALVVLEELGRNRA